MTEVTSNPSQLAFCKGRKLKDVEVKASHNEIQKGLIAQINENENGVSIPRSTIRSLMKEILNTCTDEILERKIKAGGEEGEAAQAALTAETAVYAFESLAVSILHHECEVRVFVARMLQIHFLLYSVFV
jgi:hypothetical protein